VYRRRRIHVQSYTNLSLSVLPLIRGGGHMCIGGGGYMYNPTQTSLSPSFPSPFLYLSASLSLSLSLSLARVLSLSLRHTHDTTHQWGDIRFDPRGSSKDKKQKKTKKNAHL
jgi:hypothetical protein